MKKVLLLLLFCASSIFAFEELNIDNFDEKVRGKNVILDFHKPSWGACKVLGKNLQKYNTSNSNDVSIYKINLKKEKELAERFDIQMYPILVYLKDGKVMGKDIGISSPIEIQKRVREYFK